MEESNTRELSRQMLVFHRLYREKVANRLQTLHRSSLTQGQYFLMNMIWEAGHIPTYELTARSGMQKQQVTAIVNQLEEKGLVVRSRQAQNRRVVWLTPTEEALRLRAEMLDAIETELSEVFSPLDERELGEYLNAIQTINRVLERYPSGREWHKGNVDGSSPADSV